MSSTRSPLGDVSRFYRVKSNEKGGIVDNPDKGLIEVYPAGYTKPSLRDGKNRQEAHQAIWERAVSLNKENDLYPLGKKGHTIELVHDPDNEFDEHRAAIHIILRTNPSGDLAHLDGADLGFVPKKINRQILNNISMMNEGRILKVRSNFHKKYYSVKVALGYGETTFGPLKKVVLDRFAAILEE